MDRTEIGISHGSPSGVGDLGGASGPHGAGGHDHALCGGAGIHPRRRARVGPPRRRLGAHHRGDRRPGGGTRPRMCSGPRPGRRPQRAPFAGARLGRLRPLLTDRPERFRPGPPPGLSSARHAADPAEVEAFGSRTGSRHTPEQTSTAPFSTKLDLQGALADRAARRASTWWTPPARTPPSTPCRPTPSSPPGTRDSATAPGDPSPPPPRGGDRRQPAHRARPRPAAAPRNPRAPRPAQRPRRHGRRADPDADPAVRQPAAGPAHHVGRREGRPHPRPPRRPGRHRRPGAGGRPHPHGRRGRRRHGPTGGGPGAGRGTSGRCAAGPGTPTRGPAGGTGSSRPTGGPARPRTGAEQYVERVPGSIRGPRAGGAGRPRSGRGTRPPCSWCPRRRRRRPLFSRRRG